LDCQRSNFSDSQMAVTRSNDYRLHVVGWFGAAFLVRAVLLDGNVLCNESYSAYTRGQQCCRRSFQWRWYSNRTNRISKHDPVCTPIKSRWKLPFIKDKIALMPNISNREVTNLIANHVKEKFITSNLLQNARTFTREKKFKDPSKNVLFATALVEK
jgi:hypothetical protein